MNKTEEVLMEMLTENTGIAMCDSGGKEGRAWQRNQGRDFMAEPASTVEFWRYQDGSFDPDQTHSVFHWLCGRLEYNEELDKRFQEYAKTHPDEYPMVLMEEFAQFHGNSILDSCSKPSVINTYNYDQMVSQILQFICWEDSDGQHVLLQIHGGADVRGGYTFPKAFDLPEYNELAMFDYARGGIHCPSCGEYWDTDDTCHYYHGGCCGGDSTNLEEMPSEDGEEGKVGVVVVTKDHEAFCPMCGKAKLEAHI